MFLGFQSKNSFFGNKIGRFLKHRLVNHKDELLVELIDLQCTVDLQKKWVTGLIQWLIVVTNPFFIDFNKWTGMAFIKRRIWRKNQKIGCSFNFHKQKLLDESLQYFSGYQRKKIQDDK